MITNKRLPSYDELLLHILTSDNPSYELRKYVRKFAEAVLNIPDIHILTCTGIKHCSYNEERMRICRRYAPDA